jgi:hypothetical protein
MKKSIIMPTLKTLFIFILLLIAPMAQADEKPEAPPEKDSKSSPWFVTPLVSSDPKISTAGGALDGIRCQVFWGEDAERGAHDHAGTRLYFADLVYAIRKENID